MTTFYLDDTLRAYINKKTYSPYTAFTLAQDFGDSEDLPTVLRRAIKKRKSEYKKMTKFVPLTDPNLCFVRNSLNLYTAKEKHEAQLKQLETVLYLITRPKDATVNPNAITAAQVEAARQFPISGLIEFHRSFAICPWHGEKTASLHLLPNCGETRAYCQGACHKTYDVIDAYMLLNPSATFIDAVKYLSR